MARVAIRPALAGERVAIAPLSTQPALDTLRRDSYLRPIPFSRSTGGAFRAPVGYVRFDGAQSAEMGRLPGFP
jgi:hypothetical protein